MQLLKDSFFFNTLLILITSFIIKILGLINRIFITRILGSDGISLYILSFPTIMLFISISGFSLNVTISKLVAESVKNRQLSPKVILKQAIKLSLIISAFTIGLFFLILNFLVNDLLKNPDLAFPLLSTVFLIPLVGISDALRGYFNGLKEMKHSSISNLLEQVFRIIFSIGFLFIMLPFGYVKATFFCLLAMSVGEIASIIYCLFVFKRYAIIHYDNTHGEMKEILRMSIPTTMSRLIGNFTYFLEPIVFLAILTFLNYQKDVINHSYTVLNAYTISLLTLGSFCSLAIATTIVPTIAESWVIKNTYSVNYYIKKALQFSLIPAIVITVLLFFYADQFMLFVYGTTQGARDVSMYAFFFLPYYIQAPICAIYQALGKSKQLFIISVIFNFARIALIVVLAFIPSINLQSLLWATFITLDLYCLIIFVNVKKLTRFQISFSNSLNLLIAFLGIFVMGLVSKLINLTSIASIILIIITYFVLVWRMNLLDIMSFKKNCDNR